MKLCPCCLFDAGGFAQKRTPFIVITLSGLAGPVLAAVTTFADLNIGLICSAVMLLVLAVTTWMVFPRVLLYVTISMTLINLSSPSIGSALSYFYTASEQCLPDGPHFSYTYYIVSAYHVLFVLTNQPLFDSDTSERLNYRLLLVLLAPLYLSWQLFCTKQLLVRGGSDQLSCLLLSQG